MDEGKKAEAGSETFIYVNNRLEGNALETIDSMVEDYHSMVEHHYFSVIKPQLDK